MDSTTKKFHTSVLYSSCIFAQGAQRLIKVIAGSSLSTKQKTWQTLYEMAYVSSFTNLAKVIDDKASGNVDIEELINAKNYPDNERRQVVAFWNKLKQKHEEAFQTVKSIRSDLVAHFNKTIASTKDSKKYVHESDLIQRLTYDLIEFIENLPWFGPEMKATAPQYTDYRDELGFDLAVYPF